ncbi:MAG: cytidine deaminase [archaeon]
MRATSYSKLSSIQKKVVDAAEDVMKHSYNPYSHFFVGAALLAKDRSIISGTNVENAAYGSSICAERSAILRANAMGYRQFDAIAIIVRADKSDVEGPSAPCGSCRQMLVEAAQLAEEDLLVILSNTKKDKMVLTSIHELLPLSFGPKDVGVDIRKYVGK